MRFGSFCITNHMEEILRLEVQSEKRFALALGGTEIKANHQLNLVMI